MKTLVTLFLLCLLGAFPQQKIQAETQHASKKFSIGLNVFNGTTDNSSFYLYGPTPLSATMEAGTSRSFGPLDPGTYTINVYASAPGSHTFTFNGTSITTSTGYATFSNVSITYTSSLSIY
ncbi:MAG TPA: hypothetical protein VFS25_02085 [Chitinophaga sp.]|uniref:hypothetical protein n=1 Tax=Chitinophaga sp. TaxID=1869181 RepID=UPI002DBB62D4|nr:hypothetical protein [Chitinophaga sp.]HEU4551586.1 hypothetical protein [Chitinophaga sp.]